MAEGITLRKTAPLEGLYAQLQDPLPLEEGRGLQLREHRPSLRYRRVAKEVLRKLQAVPREGRVELTREEALTLLAACLTTKWTVEGRVVGECGVMLEARLLLAEAGEGELARQQDLLPYFEEERP